MLRGLPGVCGYFRREARELGGKRHRMRDRATDGMSTTAKSTLERIVTNKWGDLNCPGIGYAFFFFTEYQQRDLLEQEPIRGVEDQKKNCFHPRYRLQAGL